LNFAWRAVPALIAGLSGIAPVNGVPSVPRTGTLPVIEWNDNRTAAGRLAGGTLTVSLEVVQGAWHPLGPDRPAGEVLAFAESGHTPSNPGPLLRMPLGSNVRVSVTNRHSKPIVVHGLTSRRTAVMDSLVIPAGEQREARFTADADGTYYYWAAELGTAFSDRYYVDSQLNGAMVVDPPGGGARANERIFVISLWLQSRLKNGDPNFDQGHLTINGRPWPLTERFTFNQGDSVHWRWVNASADVHPLHLHGFYFRVESRGDEQRDTVYWAGQQRMGVTERLLEGETMALAFAPDRPGGWVFHCHLNFHVTPNAGVGPDTLTTHDRENEVVNGHVGHDPAHHVEQMMGGLMLAFYVKPVGPPVAASGDRRTIRLFVQSDSSERNPTRRFAYVVQEGDREPAPDSVRSPGSPLILHRGEPTTVWVINRSPEPTQVHWHGLEIQSPFDGVVGVGGFSGSPTPPIMPQDSFQMRVTPPRSGSFMYHTHINDVRQQSRGLWGPILVLEPGQSWDREHDLVYQAGSSPDFDRTLNGRQGAFEPLRLRAGQTYRIRMMNVTLDGPNLTYGLQRDGSPARWKLLARDGNDLPEYQQVEEFAKHSVSIGQTMDVEFKPVAGNYQFELRRGDGQLIASQKFQVLDLLAEGQQVASAVLPLPESLRAGATVLGYREPGKLVELRKGTNGMICLADDPEAPAFHVACYQASMEPFMARGRELRASGVTGDQVDTVRFREVQEGKIKMPTDPAALWQTSGPAGSFDPVANEVKGGQSLYVVYLPFATEATTGLSATPAAGIPWLMFPGTPKAHIMFIPGM